ncbi:unnamed protein product [Protopolystoma xenopodis]|uniref:Selenoprotein O n=1 Tax=Protopolystoma xenopodis TaxID=117903 RepID=A0A448WAD3_9PLAT|nr:unnamed protein product [Protopolystoma xenopodis]
MSILGLTIDYGPFGFMDRFQANYVCNASDISGRYAFSRQPSICAWNCGRLAEVLVEALAAQEPPDLLDFIRMQDSASASSDMPKDQTSKTDTKRQLADRFSACLNSIYMPTFKNEFLRLMRAKVTRGIDN